MNVIFHTAAAIGITVLFTETDNSDNPLKAKNVFRTSILVFIVGIISHGVLDYMPHCYPINSKIDVILALIIIITTIGFINKRYWLSTGLAFTGAILPDIIDLLPSILNKQIGLNLPVMNKLFPWHLHEYSGSIYNRDCNISIVNHVLLLLTVCIICWTKRANLMRLSNKPV
jgi:hypothetical protein